MGGSNSIWGSLDSRYAARVYAASLGYSDDKRAPLIPKDASPNSPRDAVLLNRRFLGIDAKNLGVPETVLGRVYFQAGREVWIIHGHWRMIVFLMFSEIFLSPEIRFFLARDVGLNLRCISNTGALSGV